MKTGALLATAGLALAFSGPVAAAGVVDVGADQGPGCQMPSGQALDLDISLAVLTPQDLCGDVQPTAFEMDQSAPSAAAATDPMAEATNSDVVVPVPRLIRSPDIVNETAVAPVPAEAPRRPALTASLQPAATAEAEPRLRIDHLWMIGAYR